ncbi:hypothetical protein Mgra_00002687 [Meloidogyne graminicola]|uniref:Uncharacterized protein n=1 Tax=Meloidogyne graminicola TaxID=189291 RepID=A0A8S9ZXU3_9BILA|nr:hypothetical protein Mgra_00002687 [Meloidogyne graminicola]
MTLKLEPLFAQHLNNLNEFPSFIFHYLLNKNDIILIGTNYGNCFNFLTDKLKLVRLHEDYKKRYIVAIGIWPLTEENNENIFIWIHFRCSSISLFKIIYSPSNSEIIELSPLREFSTEHYGFCKSFADLNNKRMFLPDIENLINILHIYYKNGSERILHLDGEFLNKNNKEEFKIFFKGLLMGIELINENDLFLAFEDSTICILNLQNKQIIDQLKHPKHCEFICWSITCYKKQTLIAISVIGQLYLLSYFLDEKLNVECILEKTKNNINYTALAITENNFNGNPKMAAGLKNGEIQIFSLIPPKDQGSKWSKQLNACIKNIHCNSIQCLKWMIKREELIDNKYLIFLLSGSFEEKFCFSQLLF